MSSDNSNDYTTVVTKLTPTLIHSLSVDDAVTNVRLSNAIYMIDAMFGSDYAKKNPHLVAAVLAALVAASKQ